MYRPYVSCSLENMRPFVYTVSINEIILSMYDFLSLPYNICVYINGPVSYKLKYVWNDY